MNENGVESSVSGFRVIKKLSPTARGALKLARRFGESLVCVRYRVDADKRYRYTTVELVVEKSQVRPSGRAIVCVRAAVWKDSATVAQMLAAGAVWDQRAQLWRMPRRVAVALGLTGQIVER